MKIRSMEVIKEKWLRVTQERAIDYDKGVNDPKADWKTNTAAASAMYNSAMSQVIANNQFAKGVGNSSTEKWKKKAIEKGVPRFAQGVAVAGDDYKDGFTPYHGVLAALTLAPRGPKGTNYGRVKQIGDALRMKKYGRI